MSLVGMLFPNYIQRHRWHQGRGKGAEGICREIDLGHQGREDMGGGAGGEGTVVSGRRYQRAKGGEGR